jgi:AAA domain, putative AbiEii toxin, Type IV TA system
MYVEKLNLENIRTFARSELSLIHPDTAFRSPGSNGSEHRGLLPRPRLPNVNLLLGDNASGKTTVLQAIALACLGPAAREAQLPVRRLVRYSPGYEPPIKDDRQNQAYVLAQLYMHDQESTEDRRIESMQQLERRGEVESIEFAGAGIDDQIWAPVYESANAAFFCAAYGSTRRVESVDSPELDSRRRGWFVRARRVQSIFQDDFVINPMANWLPRLKRTNLDRYEEVKGLLKRMIGPGHFHFTGTIKDDELYFERSGTSVPFPGLSDGYRGFIGWAGDLLYHLSFASPRGRHLVDLAGVVMVDEIDLLLHPMWQMKVIKTIAKALPRIQFIFTSHSPLVASSLEWVNINLLKINEKTNSTVVKRLNESIHGLDADQVLISSFFGLKTTRAASKREQLSRLRQAATLGNDEAKRSYIRALASGMEETDAVTSTEPGRDEE